MTCGTCRRIQKDGLRAQQCPGIDAVKKCPTGEIPKLSADNRLFWHVFSRLLPGFTDGLGGFRYEAIPVILDTYNVPEGQRPIFMDRCTAVMAAIMENRKKK